MRRIVDSAAQQMDQAPWLAEQILTVPRRSMGEAIWMKDEDAGVQEAEYSPEICKREQDDRA